MLLVVFKKMGYDVEVHHEENNEMEQCDKCQGNGYYMKEVPLSCNRCQGAGRFNETVWEGEGSGDIPIQCTYTRECEECSGTGKSDEMTVVKFYCSCESGKSKKRKDFIRNTLFTLVAVFAVALAFIAYYFDFFQ